MSFINEYPYTDFHELNLDYVLSIAEDMHDTLEQLSEALSSITGLQTDVSALQTSMTSAQNNITQLQTLVSTHTSNISAINTLIAGLQNDVNSITNGLNTLSNTVDAQGGYITALQTLTATLNENISSIAESIQSVTGAVMLTYEAGYFPGVAVGSTGTITRSPSTTGLYSAIGTIKPGQYFSFKTVSTGTTQVQSYSILDENLKIIQRGNNTIGEYLDCVAPDGAEWITFNTKPDGVTPYYAVLYDRYSTDENYTDTALKIEDGWHQLKFIGGMMRSPTVGSASTMEWEYTSTDRVYAVAEVREGMHIKGHVGTGSTNYRGYFFLDKDMICIYRLETTTAQDIDTFAPAGAKYLIVNTQTTEPGYFAAVQDLQVLPSFNVGMFNSIAIIGTSWDSGYVYSDRTGTLASYTRRNKSWIAVLADKYGINYYNYGVVSGTTCAVNSSYIGQDNAASWQANTSNGLPKLLSDSAASFYVFNLFSNDASKLGLSYLGSISDINADYTENPDTYYGNVARIIEQVKAHAPYAKIIFAYKEKPSSNTTTNAYATAIREIANHYSIPIINWETDGWFTSWVDTHLVGNHPTFVEYAAMADAFERLFDKCVKDNISYFNNFVPA